MDEDLQIVKPVPNLINTENGVTVDLVGFFLQESWKKHMLTYKGVIWCKNYRKID